MKSKERRSVECHETYQKFQTIRRLRGIANNVLWHKPRQENQQWTSRAKKNKGVAVEFDRFIECNMVYVHGIHMHRHYMLLCAPRHPSRKMDKAIGIEPFTPGLQGCPATPLFIPGNNQHMSLPNIRSARRPSRSQAMNGGDRPMYGYSHGPWTEV